MRGFRALEVGDTLIWIAAPQLIFCPLAALMLRRTDPRLVASIGFIFISLACLIVAYGLTPFWGSDQFLPSQLLQALGQSFALSGMLVLRRAAPAAAGRADLRRRAADRAADRRRDRDRLRRDLRAGARTGASNLIGQHVQMGAMERAGGVARFGVCYQAPGDSRAGSARRRCWQTPCA